MPFITRQKTCEGLRNQYLSDNYLAGNDVYIDLGYACAVGNIKDVEQGISNAYSKHVNTRWDILFDFACFGGHLPIVELIIKHMDTINWTRGLKFACIQKNLHIIKYLLATMLEMNNDKLVRFSKTERISFVKHACYSGDNNTVDFFLNTVFCYDFSAEDWNDSLYIACVNAYDHLIQRMLDKGATNGYYCMDMDLQMCLECDWKTNFYSLLKVFFILLQNQIPCVDFPLIITVGLLNIGVTPHQLIDKNPVVNQLIQDKKLRKQIHIQLLTFFLPTCLNIVINEFVMYDDEGFQIVNGLFQKYNI